MRGRDGYDFYGSRIRVELAKGGVGGRAPPGPPPPNYRTKGSAFRVLVKNLPMSASWQDLKVGASARFCRSLLQGRSGVDNQKGYLALACNSFPFYKLSLKYSRHVK